MPRFLSRAKIGNSKSQFVVDDCSNRNRDVYNNSKFPCQIDPVFVVSCCARKQHQKNIRATRQRESDKYEKRQNSPVQVLPRCGLVERDNDDESDQEVGSPDDRDQGTDNRRHCRAVA